MRFFYTCKQAHQMLSEGMDRQLSVTERAQLKLHLRMCRSCSNFSGQMRLLREAMKKMSKDGGAE